MNFRLVASAADMASNTMALLARIGMKKKLMGSCVYFVSFEDGSYVPMASKDLDDWCICIGAYVDDEPIDLLGFAKQIQEMVEKGGEI